MINNNEYILVVDDNEGVRLFLYTFLSCEGYKVETAASGEEALLKVYVKNPVIILLDARMPSMSGLKTLAELKKFAPDIPVVIMTVYTGLPEIQEAKNQGLIQYYVEKPFDINEIRNLIAAILKEKKKDRRNTS
jgi:DNA-binding NtrC family response regulator